MRIAADEAAKFLRSDDCDDGLADAVTRGISRGMAAVVERINTGGEGFTADEIRDALAVLSDLCNAIEFAKTAAGDDEEGAALGMVGAAVAAGFPRDTICEALTPRWTHWRNHKKEYEHA